MCPSGKGVITKHMNRGTVLETTRFQHAFNYSAEASRMHPRCFSECMSARLGVVRGGLLRFGVGYFDGVSKV